MLLKEVLIKDNFRGSSLLAHQQNVEYIQEIINRIGDNVPANNMYYTLCGKNSLLKKIDKSLVENYPVKVNTGFNKTSTFFVNSLHNITVADIIKDKFDNNFIFGKNHLFYSFDAYHFVCSVTISMTLVKYDPSSLTKEHILFVCLATLLYFFKFFEGTSYAFNINEIWGYKIDEFFNTDIDKFYEFARTYDFDFRTEIRTREKSEKPRPQTLEDITSCFDDTCTTQTAKKEAIMKWWCCGERTARKYMKQFGLTEQKYVRTDYKEIHEHIDEAVVEVADSIDELSDHIDSKFDEIYVRFDDIEEIISETSEKMIRLIRMVDSSNNSETIIEMQNTIADMQEKIKRHEQEIQDLQFRSPGEYSPNINSYNPNRIMKSTIKTSYNWEEILDNNTFEAISYNNK